MLMRLALNWINRVQVTPGVQSAQHWHIWNHSHCLVFLLTIGPRLCLLLSFFLSWVTKTQPNLYCDWADDGHLMHHSGKMKLLQHFAIMRLPRDTFARRRLSVTPFKRFSFHYTSPTSTIYLIFWYLFGCLWSTTHVASVMKTNVMTPWSSILPLCDGESFFGGQTWDLATSPVVVEAIKR